MLFDIKPPWPGYKVYIAGPMSGVEGFNFDAFFAAATQLRELGFEVYNPADRDVDLGFDPEKHDPREFFDYDELILADIEALLGCDGMVLLPGWENSLGANAEVAVANWAGDYQAWELKTGDIDVPKCDIDKPILLGLAGYGGAGKDTAADAVEKLEWNRVGFADPIYNMATTLNPWFWHVWRPRRLKSIVDSLGWTAAKRIPAVRKYLQILGTEACRENLGEDVFIEAMRRRLRPDHWYVITNVRFKNEAEFVREHGGKIYLIENDRVGPAGEHSSEQVDFEVDRKIANNGSIAELHQKIINALVEDYVMPIVIGGKCKKKT